MLKRNQILNETYLIKDRIGSGGGGIIYKAFHLRMRKYVAIKLIKDSVKSDFYNRSEVDVLKNLKNDYLPQVHDFVEDGDDVYTVMEFIEGRNFKQLIEKGETFSEKQVRKYALQLCKAVEYLHNHVPPIIHSDIKPSNIMLTPDDKICLIDFNISTISDNGIGAVKGASKDFGAPEQFRRIINSPIFDDEFHEETRFIEEDETEILYDIDESVSRHSSKKKSNNSAQAYIDVRTDIFGMGASIYYMLTSRPPIGGQTDLRGIRCSSKLKEIIRKCMAPYPSKRYRNVNELEKALESGYWINPVIAAAIAVLTISSGTAVYILMNQDSNDISVDVSDGIISEAVPETEAIQEMTIDEPDEITKIVERADETTSEATVLSQLEAIDISELPKNEQASHDNKVNVPSVINTSLSEAKKFLGDSGLKIRVIEEHDDHVKEGYVFKQDIAPNEWVPIGTEIIIYVNTIEELMIVTSTAQEWNETEIDSTKTMYISEPCYTYEKPINGAALARKLNVGERINVVALTDSGYYKLSSGDYVLSVQTSDKQDLTTYFRNGTIQSKITNEYSNGDYEVTWYWENGLERYVEKYDLSGNIINLIVFSLSNKEILFNEKPVITSNGYYYTRENEDVYPYVRIYINNVNRDVTYQDYLDSSGNIKLSRSYKSGITDDGFLCITWFDNNNNQFAYKEYNADGTERLNSYLINNNSQ